MELIVWFGFFVYSFEEDILVWVFFFCFYGFFRNEDFFFLCRNGGLKILIMYYFFFSDVYVDEGGLRETSIKYILIIFVVLKEFL